MDYADFDAMWSGLLKPEEWEALWVPGRALANEPAFWEKAVDNVLAQYLEYDLGNLVPEVRDNLIQTLRDKNGDIRALHYAVATSVAYMQSSAGAQVTDHRWTYGPSRQVDAEVWIDTLSAFTGVELSRCDHRLQRPNDLLEAGSVSAYTVLVNSDWSVDEEGAVRMDYADLARTLGGCPENEAGGRFRVVSILTTSTQLNFVNDICDPALLAEAPRATAASLLPANVGAAAATTPTMAQNIFDVQAQRFLGRPATASELTAAQDSGTQCQTAGCNAEQFARAACFAILASSEMLFY